MATSNNTFIESFNGIQSAIHQYAKDKGWWELPEWWDKVELLLLKNIPLNEVNQILKDVDRNKGEQLALMHSEISECLEGLRKGNPQDDKLPEFTNEEVELADLVIRAMDYAGKYNLRLAEAIIAKHNYNLTRPYKHGNKKF